ncbi:hypothetical protein [Marmoricola sp. URHB0036]|uniref:hypothetical protein n=1 Tax=Marmoricola sp. URHB0036 TaxID=1298863 RepID=UPI00041F3D52|nr:hypothetical protein [Marmoricola sp. URHB0036]
MSHPTSPEDRDRAEDLTLEWEVELDRLELEVIRIERLLVAMKPMDQKNWVAPSPSAPMPIHLLPRAVDIHRRQGAVLDKVVLALRTTTQHRVYVESLRDPQDSAPRYLNVTG